MCDKYDEIIDRIKDEMDVLGWSKYKLAEEAGVAQSTLRDFLKSGRNGINLVVLDKISRAMGKEMWRWFK